MSTYTSKTFTCHYMQKTFSILCTIAACTLQELVSLDARGHLIVPKNRGKAKKYL